MLRVFEAIEYLQPAERGLNRPVILRGRTTDGEEASLFVKTRAGYGDRPAAPGVECFCTLLARHLGLTAPEPVCVEIPVGFDRFVFEAPGHRELVRQSPGINFGTLALGPDWKTWPVGMSPRAFPGDLIERIMAFDALVQHTDREQDNPNLLWRGREIAIIDHEKCFGYLKPAAADLEPWRAFFGINPFLRHCLRDAGRQLEADAGKSFWADLIGVEMEGKIVQIVDASRGAFPEAKVDLDGILRYFDHLNRNLTDFFQYFRHSLTR
jgi:hypothetical protein